MTRVPLRPSTTLIALLVGLATASAADLTASPSVTMPGKDTAGTSGRALHSWELPALTVTGNRDAAPKDADLVGSYGQPRWSTIRQWSEVRSYVIPEGQIEFEYWLTLKQPSRKEREDAAAAGDPAPKPEVVQMYEAEMGLGHRLQLDLYQVYKKDGFDGNNKLDATKFELRYALADWDRIWGNPTLYGEWEQAAEGPDAIEFKLLTCGNINDRLVWANNLVYEGKMGQDRETGHEFNTAVSYTVDDRKLSIGAESAIAYVTAKRFDEVEQDFTDAKDHHWEFGVGPSLRFYPTPPVHIILTSMIGLNQDAPISKTTMVAGWEF